MQLIILESNAEDFFKQALNLEKEDPQGQWRYFKFIDSNSVLGLFETEELIGTNSQDSILLHENFFKHFLGTFSPQLNPNFDLHQLESFREFCIKLNHILTDGLSVLDLSVSKKWIWSEGKDVTVSQKLFSFLEFQ